MERRKLFKPILILVIALAFNFASFFAYCNCCLYQPVENTPHACCKSEDKNCSENTKKCFHIDYDLITNNQTTTSIYQPKLTFFKFHISSNFEIPTLINTYKIFIFQNEDFISTKIFQSNCVYLL
jgi:hypothetical protein